MSSLTPRQFFSYCSKTVGARLLKLCDFYCWLIAHHFVYCTVIRDLSCCLGNPISNMCLAKNDQKLSKNYLVVINNEEK